MKSLTWTKLRAGCYIAGNFRVERTDALYGPLWKLTIDGQVFSATKGTMHECQAVAGSIAAETSLVAFAPLGSAPLE